MARSQGIEGAIIVRGSEAINTGTYLDEIPVPYLFHLFVGRSVVNPALLDDIEFYPGGMSSRFGDVTQAVVNARTLDTSPKPGLHGRVSADVLDFSVAAEARLSDHWTAQGAWRTSWIGNLISAGAAVVAASEERGAGRPEYATLHYDDLLLRAAYEDDDDRVVITGFGARDGFSIHPATFDDDLDGKVDVDPDAIPVEDLPYDPSEIIQAGFGRAQIRWDRKRGRREQVTWIAAGPDRQQSLLKDAGQLAEGIEFGELRGWTFVGRRRDAVPIGKDTLRTGLDAVVNPVVVADFGRIVSLEDGPPTTRDWRISLGA